MTRTSVTLSAIGFLVAPAMALGAALPGTSNRAGLTAPALIEPADTGDETTAETPLSENAFVGANAANLSPGFLVLLEGNNANDHSKANMSDVIYFGPTLSVMIGGAEKGCKQTGTNKNCVIFWSDPTFSYAGGDIRDGALNPTGPGFQGFNPTVFVLASVFGNDKPTGNATFPGKWTYV